MRPPPSTAGERGRMLRPVRPSRARSRLSYVRDRTGRRETGSPGWNAALRRALRGSENMESTGHSPQATGTTSGQNRHICAFFNTVDEQHRVLRPFIKDGFDRGDKAYHYVDPGRQEEHLSWLADAGIDVPEAMATGQLEVWPWQDSTLRGGRFDLDTWLASFEQVLQSGPAAGDAQTNS